MDKVIIDGIEMEKIRFMMDGKIREIYKPVGEDIDFDAETIMMADIHNQDTFTGDVYMGEDEDEAAESSNN